MKNDAPFFSRGQLKYWKGEMTIRGLVFYGAKTGTTERGQMKKWVNSVFAKFFSAIIQEWKNRRKGKVLRLRKQRKGKPTNNGEGRKVENPQRASHLMATSLLRLDLRENGKPGGGLLLGNSI